MPKMKISGFTYVRNGYKYDYPFISSIKSLLPIVDELVVVVGDSTDATRESIEKIRDSRIKIIDSIWNEEMRKSGKIFAQQSNLGLREISGRWGFHLQVDEVLHESAKELTLKFIAKADKYHEIDGLLFPYYNFWGDYSYIRTSRNAHRYEIRLFKNDRNVYSYKDSQGFRKYDSYDSYNKGEKGNKLIVIKTDIPIYHYSHVRNPKLMTQKANFFSRFYHSDEWLSKHALKTEFDYNNVDKLEKFCGDHPIYMREIINNKDWNFTYDPSKSNMSIKDKVLNKIEQIIDYRFFEYKNYILKKI